MFEGLPRFAESGVVFGVVLAGAVAAFLGLFLLLRRRTTPAERERRRRLAVHREGRITDGTVFDIRDEPPQRLICYTYLIGGVEYSAAQEVSTLSAAVGDDPSRIVGSAAVKYKSRNPYNSIVVCEEWSGLRKRTREASAS